MDYPLVSFTAIPGLILEARANLPAISVDLIRHKEKEPDSVRFALPCTPPNKKEADRVVRVHLAGVRLLEKAAGATFAELVPALFSMLQITDEPHRLKLGAHTMVEAIRGSAAIDLLRRAICAERNDPSGQLLFGEWNEDPLTPAATVALVRAILAEDYDPEYEALPHG